MITKGLIIDTETGGLDARLNPLLSINLLVFQRDPEHKILDNFHIKILPPEGTLLQIPEDPEDQSFNPKVAHLVDANGNFVACDEKGSPKELAIAERAPIITAGAARVNGFTWEGWKGQAVPKAQADASFRKFITTWFDRAPTAYAHNAEFDEKFVLYAFPETHSAIRRPWLCTMKMYQKYLKDRKEKASAKLAELYKRAAADSSTPAYRGVSADGDDLLSKAHDALADTKMCHAALVWLAAKIGDASVFPTEAPDEHPED